MTKHIIPTHQVARCYMAQSPEWAANGKRSVSYSGQWFKSYSTTIASLETSDSGQRMLFLASDGYSITTTHHGSHLWSAAYRANVKVFHCVRGQHNAEGARAYSERRIAEKVAILTNKRCKARSKEWARNCVAGEYQKLYELIELTGVGTPIPAFCQDWLDADNKVLPVICKIFQPKVEKLGARL